ncbi:MAG: low molecular weight protein-tyrosine-phosphatase [Rhodospirillales bacterium]|nr:low molecular weight protein-tyrosine-phosphatase [Rhodospirillales bacterium]
MVNVLFVCLGNICRSPAAEGVFRALVEREGLADRIACDSAGTGSWHVGKVPDARMRAAAKRRGYDLESLRGRQVTVGDFERFDYVLAMDGENLANLTVLCPPGREGRLGRLLDFAPGAGRRDVPDPYYGGADGFERVLDLVEAGAAGLLADIRARHL